MDFDRDDAEGRGRYTLAWLALASGGLAMFANMLWLPVINVVFSLGALGLAWLALRGAPEGSDQRAWSVAALWLAIGNFGVLMVVLAIQIVFGGFFLMLAALAWR
ncbi:MAG: hypothetical protein H6737_21590 [Alphaproteobacteria bacterium]|nr:hypothetical protein [Alphaproteobacteria bacterium]